MRASTSIVALATISGALAQFPPAIQGFIGNLSSSCQQTVLQLAAGSELSQCLRIQESIPVLTSALSGDNSTSVVPALDQLLNIDCNQPGCSNSTLTAAYQQVIQGCSTDLQQYNVSNSTVRTVFQQYPLAREVSCLKTVNGTSTNGTSGDNSTSQNGTFCVTSLLTTVQERIGRNLSIGFFTDLATSYMAGTFNSTASRYFSNFTTEDLCNDCIFAAADVIGVAYPSIGNLTLSSLGFSSNSTGGSSSTYNTTVAQALDSTCSSEGLTWNSNGTLPESIRLGAVNSTFGYPLTPGNGTRPAPASPTPIRRNIADIKARWIGQQL